MVRIIESWPKSKTAARQNASRPWPAQPKAFHPTIGTTGPIFPVFACVRERPKASQKTPRSPLSKTPRSPLSKTQRPGCRFGADGVDEDSGAPLEASHLHQAGKNLNMPVIVAALRNVKGREP